MKKDCSKSELISMIENNAKSIKEIMGDIKTLEKSKVGWMLIVPFFGFIAAIGASMFFMLYSATIKLQDSQSEIHKQVSYITGFIETIKENFIINID